MRSLLLGWLAISLGTVSAAHAQQNPVAGAAPRASDAASAAELAPSEMLKRYLLDQAKLHFDARRKAIAAIKTSADIERRQKELRAFFLASLGDVPERTPLNPKVVGSLKRDGYRVDKVIFESRPRHHVTGNLYLPEGNGPFPGVLVPCGHGDNGKAYESYQRICILLARNGMVALCYDPIGQGERFQLLDSSGKPVIRGTTEHTMAGIGALLIGRQLASYRIWDGFRALDYLASRTEVDPNRLGCTGNSGGGTMTAYLMALDDRIKVAAPSCYITSLERLFETIGPQDAEQNITGQVAALMEHADFVTMRAPKPTLLSVGTRDFFDIRGSWDTFREVKLVFGRLGFGERVDLFESDEEHGFTRPRRVSVARWMRRWLLKQDEAVDEPDFPIATDAELQCTRTGQVLTDFKGVSVFELNRERDRELQKDRVANHERLEPDAFRTGVKTRLGLSDWKPRPLQVKKADVLIMGFVSGNPSRYEVAPGIEITVDDTRFGPQAEDVPALVIVGRKSTGTSRPTLGVPKGLDFPYGRIISLDLPGQEAPAAGALSREGQSPFGRDWREAFLAFSMDKPLLGQRATELLNVLETLNAEAKDERPDGFHVVGLGPAGPVVLHAALLDQRGLIKKVVIQDSLVSWANLIENGLSRDQLANVVPGALTLYDLPDLAARLAPLPLSIVGSVDALGQAVPVDRTREIYAGCIRKYGASGAIDIR
jgi:dienelactone hydrolase